MTPLERVLGALERDGCRPKRAGNGHEAQCPAHDDKSPSLSVGEGEGGRVLLRCHAGCTFNDIMRALNLPVADAFPDDDVRVFNGERLPIRRTEERSSLGEPETVYDYRDEHGSLLYQVLRYKTEGGKTFRQRQPDGDGWGWGLEGVRRVLYRLPEVLSAIARGEVVYLAEGEKDVQTLEGLGVVATCALGGCCDNAGSWLPSWTDALRGAQVVILPDNDPPGERHAEIVRDALSEAAQSVRIVHLPNLPPKGDPTDWVTAGGTATTLTDLSVQTRLIPLTLKGFQVQEFTPKVPLLGEWFCTADINMIYAKRGIGKTNFLIGIMLALASGESLLGWEVPEPVEVLYVDGEMPGAALQTRLMKGLLGLSKKIEVQPRIVTPDAQSQPIRRLSTPEGRADLEEVIQSSTKVIIIDNLACLYGGNENDADSWDEMQAFLLSLRTRGIATLIVHHAGKGGAQRGTSHREDILDNVLNLRQPADYAPSEGARFEIVFEKHRNIWGDDIPQVEAQLIDLPEGGFSWGVQHLEQTRLQTVADMLNDGMKQADIAGEMGISQSTVSKLKGRACELGLVNVSRQSGRAK